jgi:hypothetical protein
MYSPIPINEVILPRFSSVTLSDAVQLVPAERTTNYLAQQHIDTSAPEAHCQLDMQVQPFSLRLGSQATSAFVPISPVRNEPSCAHLHKKSKRTSLGGEVLLSSVAGGDSISNHDQDDDLLLDDSHVFQGLQEISYHDESDDGFFLLAPGLDGCPDFSTREEREKKRILTSPSLELRQGSKKQEHAFSLYMPSAVKRKPRISLQPRLKKNVIFF